MSGPPYPPPPRPGNNAIGSFAIGISPIGTIKPFDEWTTIISQYANSDALTALIGSFDACLDQTKNFDDFFDLIWNVNTAVGYGLDVWGRIVGVGRVLQIEVGAYFGMEGPAGSSGEPYSVAPFYAGTTLTNNYALTDDAYRKLIFAKALANISDGSIKSINQILLNLFPFRGNCYVADGNDMTLTYTFLFALSLVELAIVQQSGVLPKPTGILVKVSSPN